MAVATASKITALFSKYDKSGDGFIERCCLEAILISLGIEAEDVAPIIKQVDKNGDGRIPYADFAYWIMAGDRPAAESRELEVRPFSECEWQAAWTQARYFAASGPHVAPVALWIIGPSAVGKTTLSAQMAPEFGICALPNGDPDFVVVDGELFRDVHEEYKRWAKSPQWVSAYPAYKRLINEEKDRMLSEAAKLKKHLVIPHTCNTSDELNKCLAYVSELERLGYTNHVLVIIAPRQEVARRGEERAKLKGKRYNADEFPRTLAAMEPMIHAGNGRYELILSTELNVGDRMRLGHRKLASDRCCPEVRLNLEAHI